jgi:translation initiation factor 2-alpha kinase 3
MHDPYKDLKKEDKIHRRMKRSSINEQVTEHYNEILFEEDSEEPSKNNIANPGSDSVIKSMFDKHKESQNEDSDEDASGSTEEVEIFDALGPLVKRQENLNKDYIIYISMAPYPLSLENYLWPNENKDGGKSIIKHCFHKEPTLRLLLAILDGVEYLHRMKIIHRDLKPANIFLAILDKKEPPRAEYITITECTECNDRETDGIETLHVCPRIGDFGLVHELRYNPTNECNESNFEEQATVDPFPFCPSHQVQGTPFYCPKEMPATEPLICTKLDVYSLGIIAFELLYKFTTRTERHHVLTKLKGGGEIPKDFKFDDTIRNGILAMIKEDRDKRWTTAEVKLFLQTELAKCVHQAEN